MKEEYKANNVLIFGSNYVLLLYLLMKKNWKDTIFITNNKISEKILKRLEKTSKLFVLKNNENEKKITKKIYNHYIEQKRLYKFKKKIKNEVDIYGQDHIFYLSIPFLKQFNNVIEDGLRNYIDEKKLENLEKGKMLKIFFLNTLILRFNIKFLKYKCYGFDKITKKIYLTNPEEIKSQILREKSLKLDIHELWRNKTIQEKNEILKLFNAEKYKNINLKNSVIILTQPLSEDKIVTEQEKIDIYRKIIEKIKNKKIYIKPHPREKTDYKKIISTLKIIEKDIPIELLALQNLKDAKIITLFSTGARIFKEKCEVEWLGTKVDDRILEKFGDI